MADQKITDYDALTTPAAADLVEIVDDVAGVPTSKKIELEHLLGIGQSACNLICNSPGQIVTDGAEPQWWDVSANAALTDEDAAGEGIPDSYGERVFKLVTSADNAYGYQTLTFANESLLDAGVTVVSLSIPVYCATGAKASIGIYGTNLGLQESDQAGAGAWEILTVENITLDGADTSIEVRLYGDTITAYFGQRMMLNLGPKAMPWVPRDLQYVPQQNATQINTTTGDVAWSDTDCTANTDPLAAMVQFRMYVFEPDGLAGSYLHISHDSAVTGADIPAARVKSLVAAVGSNQTVGPIFMDDSQVVRYGVSEIDADNDVTYQLLIPGYWRWSP